MKSKISLSLSGELLRDLDGMANPGISRSSFIEKVLRDFLEQRSRQERRALETAAINQQAEELNTEMSDALSLQARND